MRQRGTVGCVLVLVFLLGGCQLAPWVGPSYQSSCHEVREDYTTTNTVANVELQVEGSNLTIFHRDALTNCCLTTAMEAGLTDKNITVWEREQPGVACRCLCLRDLSVTIYYLGAGLYTVRLYRDDEPEPFWEGMVQIK